MLHLGGKSTPDLLARRLGEPADGSGCCRLPRLARRRAGDPRGLRRARHRRRPLRRRHERGGRRRPRVRRARARHRPRPRPHRGPARPRRDLAARDIRRGHDRPQAEEMLAARGFTLGHFPQSFRYASIGGFAADPLERSGLARLRAIRRPRPRAARRHSGGRTPPRTRARERRRTRPPAALPRVRGRLRRAHRGHRADPPCARRDSLRSLDVPRLRVGGRCTPHGDAARHPSHRPAVERRVRDARQRGPRRACDPHARRSGRRDIRGDDQRGGGGDPCGPPRGVRARTAGDREARSPPVPGSAAVSPRRRCATRSWIWASSPRRSRPRRRGRSCPASSARSRMRSTASLSADGTKPIVMCHISHVYPAGASLYFTVVAALTPDPVAQWRRAKDAASRAIGSRRRDDHPPPRCGPRSPPLPGARDRAARGRGAPRGQAHAGPDGDHEPRRARDAGRIRPPDPRTEPRPRCERHPASSIPQPAPAPTPAPRRAPPSGCASTASRRRS